MDKIFIETNLVDTRTTQDLLTAIAKTQSFKPFPLGFFPKEDGRIEVSGDKKIISFIRRVFSEIGFGASAMLFVGFQERDAKNVLLAIAQCIAVREHPINYRTEILLVDGRIIAKIPDTSEVTQKDIELYIEAISVLCDDSKMEMDILSLGKQGVVAV